MLFMFFVLPHFVKPWAESITPAGVALVCIFVGVVVGITMTNDYIMPSFLAMSAVVLNKVMKPAAIIQGFMGPSYIWQILMIYALAYVLVRDRTGEVIAYKLLSMKITKKSPAAMVTMLFIALGVASAFMGVFGCLVIGYALIDSIYDQAGLDRYTRMSRLIYLGAFVTMCQGPVVLAAMSGSTLAVGALFQSQLGVNVLTIRFSAITFLIMVLFSVLYTLLLKSFFKCDLSIFANVDATASLPEELHHFTKRQRVPLYALILIALYTTAASYMPADLPVLGALKGMGTAVFFTFVLGLLALVRVDGEQIFNPAEALKNGVNWPVVMLYMSLACLGSQMSSADFGVMQWLTSIITSVFNTSNPVVFVVLTVVITALMTNVLSNGATYIIVGTLIVSLAQPMVDAGYNVTGLLAAIGMPVMCAYLTYAASGQTAVLLGHDHINMKFLWTDGLIVLLLSNLITATVCIISLFI